MPAEQERTGSGAFAVNSTGETDQVFHLFSRWYQLSPRLDYPISSGVPSGHVNPPVEV